MGKINLIRLVVITLSLANVASATFFVNDEEWNEYKAKFNKSYSNSRIIEAGARLRYTWNKKFIERHNVQYRNGLKTFKLGVNQFTDMRFIHFKALFPAVVSTGPSFDSPPPPVQPALPSYHPINDFGVTSKIENQGIQCNSGWAFSVAKSIELLRAQQEGTSNSSSLSAQNLIDCAGRSAGCKNQEPLAAFDYLTRYNMDLHLESDYNNNISLKEPGMCMSKKGQQVTNLLHYSRLKDGDDESLKMYVSNGFPVVVEFNPNSFEFMHYAEGVFQQHAIYPGSHFMVVIGYFTDPATGLDCWLLQNSFGTTWGEMGLMKLIRSTSKKLTKSALFPSELA